MLLKFLRKRKNMKRIMWALAILIIPAFVIWGSGTSDKKREKGPDYAGRIFNKKISFEEYTDMWNVMRDYAFKSFGNNIPTELIDELAWSRLILLEEAKRENIYAKDSEVVEKIASFPAFQRNGFFDKKLYKSMLSDTARAFEEKLRDDIIISKIRENVTKGVWVNDEEVRKEYEFKFKKVGVSYVSIPFSGFEKDVTYKEPDLIKFYDFNKEIFRKAEEVNVKYIQILFSDFKNQVTVTDEEIKKYFEEHLPDYKKPDSSETPALDENIKNDIHEKLSLEKAKSLVEERAYKVLDEAIKKKSLEESAGLFFTDVKETGFFSGEREIPGIGWSYEFIKTSFELNPDDISKILIKLDNGLCIIQLKEKKKPYIPEFREVKELAAQAYIKDASIKLSKNNAEKFLSDINNEIKNGGTFEDAVKKYGLQVKQTEFLTEDSYIPDLGPAKEILKTALSSKIGQILGLIKGLNAWVILRPDEFQQIDETKFLEERDKFKEAVLSAKKEQTFDKWFQELKRKTGFISFTNLK